MFSIDLEHLKTECVYTVAGLHQKDTGCFDTCWWNSSNVHIKTKCVDIGLVDFIKYLNYKETGGLTLLLDD